MRLDDAVIAADGTLTLDLPADGIVTASSLTTASHGQPASPIPSPAPFPLPYSDDFSAYSYDAMPHYLSDQGGSFAVRNGSLHQVVLVRAGPNAWVNDPDPITLLGENTPWADITVSVTAAFDAETGRLRDSNPPAHVSPCASSGPTAAAQAWVFGSPATGYLSNSVAGGSSVCVNSDGCESHLIYYECLTSGGTCCGLDCYEGLQFELNPNGSLTTPLLPGMCATAAEGALTVDLASCGPGATPPPLQAWAYNTTSGQLRVAGLPGMCLTSNLVPAVPYVQLCTRVTGYSGFAGPVPVPGYCLRLDGTGTWEMLAGAADAPLANGTLSDFVASAPHALSLTAQGTTLVATVNGTLLGRSSSSAYAAGMVAFGSGYHPATFDDFYLSVPH